MLGAQISSSGMSNMPDHPVKEPSAFVVTARLLTYFQLQVGSRTMTLEPLAHASCQRGKLKLRKLTLPTIPQDDVPPCSILIMTGSHPGHACQYAWRRVQSVAAERSEFSVSVYHTNCGSRSASTSDHTSAVRSSGVLPRRKRWALDNAIHETNIPDPNRSIGIALLHLGDTEPPWQAALVFRVDRLPTTRGADHGRRVSDRRHGSTAREDSEMGRVSVDPPKTREWVSFVHPYCHIKAWTTLSTAASVLAPQIVNDMDGTRLQMYVLAALALALLQSPFAQASYADAFSQAPDLTPGSAPLDGFASFTAASAFPNISHAVQFSHVRTSSNPIITQNWTWSVDVNDVPMGNASALGVAEGDAHIAYITYKFSWPESGDLDQALRTEENSTRTDYPSCAILISALWPHELSNSWDESSSGCLSALGSDCVNYLRANWTAEQDCTLSTPYTIDDPYLYQVCSTSFGAQASAGVSWGVGGYGTSSPSAGLQAALTCVLTPSSSIAFGNVSNDSTPVTKGDVYAYAVSEPYAAGNDTVFKFLASNLQVLIFTGQQNHVLCNRAGTATSAAHMPALDTGFAMLSLVALGAMMINFS
nr:hypothetical protein CFP56_28745 [Quercus suber]